MTIYGKVLAVESSNLGEPAIGAHSIGATTLTIGDGSTFEDTGGTVKLEDGRILTYISADIDAGILTLSAALAVAVEDQSYVEVYPTQPVKVALVDIGDEGDPVPCTVPHSLVEEFPDGVREPDSGETVTVEQRGDFEYVIADQVAEPLVVGAIDSDRLSVGVLTNLVVDPNLTLGNWAPIDDWTIGYEETGDYAGVGYFRAANRAAHDVIAVYSTADDSTYFLTPPTAVEPGKTVRVAAMVRRDAASIVSASGTPKVQLRVVFTGEEVALSDGTVVPAPTSSDTAEMGEYELEFDMVADTWTPLETAVIVPDGMTSFRAMLQTCFQLAGNVDFIKPEVQVLWDRLQSAGYVEGEVGFSFGSELAQVQNLNVLEELGADTVTARSITIDGADVETRLNALPQGIVAYARSYGLDTGAISTTETITHEFHGGSLTHGRMYRLSVHGFLNSTTSDNLFDLTLRYTTDGTTPTTSSAILDGSLTRIGLNPQSGKAFALQAFYYPANDYDNTKFSLSIKRISGTGSGSLLLTDVNKNTEFCIEDLGACVVTVTSGGGGILSQKSKSSGSADATPTAVYSRTYWANWSGSYQSSTTSNPYDERPDGTTRLYQGVSSTRVFGNQRSLFGLPYATIQADLTGATITAVYLTFRLQAAAGNDGIELHCSSHNYTAKPSTFNPANVNNDRATWGGRKEGSTYKMSMGTTVGNELKAGTTKGFGFGPAPGTSFDAYYGYAYGSGSNRPRVTIEYTK